MAKKRGGTTGRSLADQLPNRAYVTVTWGAAATTAVATPIDTMMGAREGAAWLISRIDVMPKNVLDGWAGTGSGSVYQLQTGDHSATPAIKDVDDDEVVGTIMCQVASVGSAGLYPIMMPMRWIGPVLVASRKLTCVMDNSDNILPFQSTDFVFTIWFNWIKMTAQRWIEVQEAKGVL